MRRVTHFGGSGDGSGLESLTRFVTFEEASDSCRIWARVGPCAASGSRHEQSFMSKISHCSSRHPLGTDDTLGCIPWRGYAQHFPRIQASVFGVDAQTISDHVQN